MHSLCSPLFIFSIMFPTVYFHRTYGIMDSFNPTSLVCMYLCHRYISLECFVLLPVFFPSFLKNLNFDPKITFKIGISYFPLIIPTISHPLSYWDEKLNSCRKTAVTTPLVRLSPLSLFSLSSLLLIYQNVSVSLVQGSTSRSSLLLKKLEL